jgi:Ser/Thr protein kinase RdoA (MazF antagonist)
MNDPFAPPATTIADVLAGWEIDAAKAEVTTLPVSGSSGSPVRLVRPHATGAAAVLKAFAIGTQRDRAAWVHALMRHLARAGIEAVPDLLVARHGDTIVTDARGIHWELVRFVDGRATDEPSVAEAVAAASVLARLHVAAATLPETPVLRGPSPGIATRIERARVLQARPWRARLTSAAPAALASRFARVTEAFARYGGADALEAVARTVPPELPLQAVLRDIWSDHMLYQSVEQALHGLVPHGRPQATPRVSGVDGRRIVRRQTGSTVCDSQARPATVAGIVDYHAAGIDTPATDLARLLGSWRRPPAAASPELWPEALAAYEAVRPLTATERALVPWLHATGVVVGLDNWFRWTLEEGRRFAAPGHVLGRIDRLSSQLPGALELLCSSPRDLV